MWINVLTALTTVMKMQLVTTVQEITPALATLDTQAMGLYAPVSLYIDTRVVLRQQHCVIKLQCTIHHANIYPCTISSNVKSTHEYVMEHLRIQNLHFVSYFHLPLA